jgi:DNA-binding GntR family transcriptional regulator
MDIFETLRDRICLLDYPPGTVLREAELAAEFGVSRTPIRAVLQQLAHGGLVAAKDGVGTIVTDLPRTEIRDIYLMRMKTAELIGAMDPLPLDPALGLAIAGLRAQAADLQDQFDIHAYWRINHELHLLIGGVIGNTALREIWDHFYFKSARHWYQHARNSTEDVSKALVAELDEVLRAVNEGDATALGYVQRNSIAYGLARLIA